MAALVDQSQSTTIEEYLQSARDEGAEIFQPDIEVSFLGSKNFFKKIFNSYPQTASTVNQR